MRNKWCSTVWLIIATVLYIMFVFNDNQLTAMKALYCIGVALYFKEE